MNRKTIYHVIPNLVIGGAQQALKTLIDHSKNFTHKIYYLSDHPSSIWNDQYSYEKISILNLIRRLKCIQCEDTWVHFHWFPPLSLDLNIFPNRQIKFLVSIQDNEECTLKNADAYILSRKDALFYSPCPNKTFISPPALDTKIWSIKSLERKKGLLVRHSTLYPSKISLRDIDDILTYDPQKYQWKIIGVGDEQYIESIRLRCMIHANVELTSSQNICELLNRGWLYVYHSASNYEQYGLCFREALASGLPVITNDLGGARIQIQNGVTGYVCKSIAEMKERVEMLYNDENLYHQLYSNVQRINFENDLLRYIQEHENIYSKNSLTFDSQPNVKGHHLG